MVPGRKEPHMDTIDTPLLHAVLVFLIKDDKVLLGRKKATAKIGANTRNGPGGLLDPEDEGDVARAMNRELKEEMGLTAAKEDLEQVAIVDFHNQRDDGVPFIVRVHVFVLRTWHGDVVETPEMLDPTWYELSELPFNEMMLADKAWVPQVFSGKPFYAEAWYGPKQQELLRPVAVTPCPLDELRLLWPS